jgi:hypothetical protein
MLDSESTLEPTLEALSGSMPVLSTAPAPAEAVAIGPIQAPPRPIRIPHFGHLAILGMLLGAGLLCAVILILIAVHFRLFGVTSLVQATHSMSFAVGTMICWYLIAFAPAAVVFPYLWRKGVLAGLQWNASTARRLAPWLMATGVACFLLAVAARKLLHFPDHSPIAGLLSTPQAMWIMFAFSISIAPLCEEILFRGFLLPSLSTAFDWTGEKLLRRPAPALLENGHPQWSLAAILFASVLTSALFALFHVGQIGRALGPVLLIFCVSLVLCAVRLKTRSLAASTLTHAAYNFTLFFVMLIATHGFRHLHS